MIQIEKSFNVSGEQAEVGSATDRVAVTETVEFGENDVEAVLNKLACGEYQSHSERAIWQKLCRRGTVVERNERIVNRL